MNEFEPGNGGYVRGCGPVQGYLQVTAFHFLGPEADRPKTAQFAIFFRAPFGDPRKHTGMQPENCLRRRALRPEVSEQDYQADLGEIPDAVSHDRSEQALRALHQPHIRESPEKGIGLLGERQMKRVDLKGLPMR